MSLLALPSHASLILDGSFESATSGGTYPYGNSLVYGPTSPFWTFAPGAGEQNGTEGGVHFEVPGNAAQDGLKIAFVQGVGSSIGQSFLAPTAGTYSLSYYVAGRDSGGAGNVAGNLTYEVWLDATLIATDATVSSQPWTLKTYSFAAVAGPHALSFIGTGTPAGAPDQTMLLDNVSIVPEPQECLLLAGLGLAGFAAVRRRQAR